MEDVIAIIMAAGKGTRMHTNKAKVGKKEVSLAGKDVWFTFKINSLKKTKLTDKVATKLAKEQMGEDSIKTAKALKAYAKKKMRENKIYSKVWDNIVKNSKVIKYNEKELQEEIKRYTDYQLSQYQQSMGKEVPLKEYLKAMQMTKKQWNKQARKACKESLKQNMLIREIAEEAGLKLSAKEYKKKVKDIAKQQGTTVKDLEKQYGKTYIETIFLQDKVVEYICDNVKEKKGSEPTTTPAPTTTKKASKAKKSNK